MGVKMELAGRIVADFHSQADAAQALDDFNREVRQGRAGRYRDMDYGAAGDLRVPQMHDRPRLAPTRTEAERLIKSGAVEIGGVRADRVPCRGRNLHRSRRQKWKRIIVTE
jgi:tyrosyl-tRNA synthetase